MPRPAVIASIIAVSGALVTFGIVSAPRSPQAASVVPASRPQATPATPRAEPKAADTKPATPIASDLGADAQIAAILESNLKSSGVPALAAAVVKDGRVIGSAAVGVRKMKDPTQVTVDDPFHLGTNTKALTATLIGRMVDQGSLKWDTTVTEVLGREIAGIHPDLATVTVDQLLHHRSGMLARGPNEIWQAAQRAKGTPTEQRMQYCEAMLTRAPAKLPGQYQYSNAGYAVLGLMAETVAKKPYEQLMKEEVFTPLGLTTAGFGPPGDSNGVTAPWPHLDGGPAFIDNPEAVAPGMRVHMSVRDWAKFANFQLGHQPTPPLLKPETLAHLHELAGQVADDQMGYACGWFRPKRDWAGGRTLHHIGGNMVNFSEIWLAPDKDFGVMVCCNEGNADAADTTEAVCSALIKRFLGVDPGELKSARERTNQVRKPKS
ncbi:MAG: serine hydrolase domain-containing protein [Planctomycetota bacterium]